MADSSHSRHSIANVGGQEVDPVPDDALPQESTLVFYLRPARRKARVAATVEALCLLEDLSPSAPVGGPLSEQGGLFWITLSRSSLTSAVARMPRLGYTYAVDLVEPVSDIVPIQSEVPGGSQASIAGERLVRWRRKLHRLVRIYEEDPAALRESAVDRRTFLLETPEGEIRTVRGYRGDSHALSRRGLPVYDARLLVNLVSARPGQLLLDPFAGAGGIVVEAVASGATVVSSDIDPILRHGLAALGATHHVADASALPFVSESFDSIATEPPYHESALPMLRLALREMNRVLKVGGRIAMLCSGHQGEILRRDAATLGLEVYLDTPINRKGVEVVAFAWRKTVQ